MLTKLAMLTAATGAAGIVGLASAGVASLDFSGTIGLGSILVGLLVTILAGGANLRGRLLKDQIDGWRGNYLQEKEHGTQLEERLKDALEQLAAARLLIQRLEQLPNLERLVRLMADIQERQESRAQERHVEVMAAITANPR